MPTFNNTFVNGMSVDVDEHLQKNSTYRYAIGARLMYNKSTDPKKTFEENIKGGVSLALVVIKGTKFELAICNGYKFVGSVDTIDGTVLFTTNGINSEIGILTVNRNVFAAQHAVYTTLYNDRNDPNYKNNIYGRRNPGEPGGDLLNFSTSHYIHGYVSKENEFINRIYFVDGYNQKRVINLPLFYKPNGEPYHPANASCNALISYPKHLSVHAMDERMDLVFPKMKFDGRIKGQLKSGMYQILVQYYSVTGHSSVWSKLTLPLYVTDQKIDGLVDGDPNAYKSNHHNRSMGASNIMTEEGLRFKLSGVDTRWDKIRVAYVFHATEVTPEEQNIFTTIDINDQTEIFVDLVKNAGQGITIGQINQRFETILSVGTTAQQENRSWDGNIELLPDMAMDLSKVTIEPTAIYFRADETKEPLFSGVANKVTGRLDNDPFTNSAPTTKTITVNNFSGSSEEYTIRDDYHSYKGQLFSQMFKGYFRGETYSFGFLWIDRKGNPLFVQHIQDVTFPNMYDRTDTNGNPVDWTLTRQAADTYFDLRVMGVKISNIQIPVHLLYDKFGRLNVSGFQIVRTERNPSIANQGLLFNCTVTKNGATDNEGDLLVHPMEFWENTFVKNASGEIFPNSHHYNPQDILSGSDYDGNGANADPSKTYGIAGFFNYHSPDILIEQKLGNSKITQEELMGGQMEKAGFVHRAYTESRKFFLDHHYTKVYRTSPLDFTDEREKIQYSRARLGSKSRVKMALLHTQSSLHVYEKFDPETADRLDYRVALQTFLAGNTFPSKSTQQPYSVIMKLLDWKLIDSVEAPNSRASFPLVNWRVKPDPIETALESRRYISTGHFQPITDQIVDLFEKKYDDNGKLAAYVVNDIEVGGGDCYVNLFDFTRLYPEYTNCVKDGDNKYPDYSISLISPIESKYNLALLYGRRFAANAVMPQQVSCNAANNRIELSNGVMPSQPEDWNYNSALLLQEPIKYYNTKPADIKIVTRKEAGIWWSPKKINGELEDSYRQKLTNDFSDAEGSYGAIQKFAQAMNGLYVVQEKAFGLMETSLRNFIPTENGDQIYVKSAEVFAGIRYHSRKYGSQHKNSIWSDGNDLIGFTDAREGKIMVFSQAGLDRSSESNQMNDPVAEITMYFDRETIHDQDADRFMDIITGYDNENSEVLTTFHRKVGIEQTNGINDRSNEVGSYTFIYNRAAGKFHGYHHLKPYIYINSGRFLLTPNPTPNRGNELFLTNHGKYGHFFGKYYDTEVEFYVDPQPNVEKVFDNGFINVNQEGNIRISKIIHEIGDNIHILVNSEKVGGQISRPDRRVIFDKGLLRFPMFEADRRSKKAPLRGQVLKVKLIIDNSQQEIDGKDLLVALTNFDTRFRLLHPYQY